MSMDMNKMLQQVQQFRELLRHAPRDSEGAPVEESSERIHSWASPEVAVVRQIETLAYQELTLIVPALRTPLLDRNCTVTSGAPEARSLLRSTVRTTLSARTSGLRTSSSSASCASRAPGIVVSRAVTSSRSSGRRGPRPAPQPRDSTQAQLRLSLQGSAHRSARGARTALRFG